MLQFLVILFFAGSLFVLVSIRAPKVARHFIVIFSFSMFVATIVFWVRGQMSIEDGVNFQSFGNSACEIDCYGGKVNLLLTRYRGWVQIVGNQRNFGPLSNPKYCLWADPPDSPIPLRFYSFSIDNPQENPRLFEKFRWTFVDWNSLGIGPIIEPRPERCYHSLEIPYWFFALSFGLFPSWWFWNCVRKRTQSPN